MHLRHQRRQQAVARHREQDARLAEQEHQQHAGDAGQRPDAHDHRGPRHVERVEDERHRVGHVELLEGTTPVMIAATDDVQDRRHRERAHDADRHVALGVDRLLGGGRHRVEPNVGEEHDRRRGHDALESERHERTPVRGVDVPGGQPDEDEDHHDLDDHHGQVDAGALLDPATRSQVSTAMISTAGRFRMPGR